MLKITVSRRWPLNGMWERSRPSRMKPHRGTATCRLGNRVKEFGPLELRGIAVHVKEEIRVAMVCRLQGRSRVDMDESAASDVDALRWLAEVHRQGSLQDDEGLLLTRMPMASTRGPGLVPPDVRSGMSEPGLLA